jgi:sugar phosphate permease
MNAVANWFQRDVGKALGVVASGFGAGGLVVPVIVWLIDRFHWQVSLQIIALSLLTLGIPLCLVIRNKPEDHGLLPDGDRSLEGKTIAENAPKEQGVGFRIALRTRGFWYLCASEALRFMVLSAVVIHIMPYLSGLAIPRNRAGFIAAALPLLSIVGRFSFGWLADIYDKRYVMCTTFVLMGLGFLAFTYMDTGWLLIPFLVLFPPAFGGGMVLRGAILRDYFGRATFSRLLGITMGIGSIGGIVGPVIAGWVFDTTGAYHSAWLAFSMVLFVPVALLLMIDPHAGKETSS